METNTPLAYALVLEIHHPIMSTLGGHGGRLEIVRDREKDEAGQATLQAKCPRRSLTMFVNCIAIFILQQL